MKRAILIQALVISLLLCFLSSVRAADIWVPDNYASIQTGLNAASTGDTVWVRDGTYYENVDWPSVDIHRVQLVVSYSSSSSWTV